MYSLLYNIHLPFQHMWRPSFSTFHYLVSLSLQWAIQSVTPLSRCPSAKACQMLQVPSLFQIQHIFQDNLMWMCSEEDSTKLLRSPLNKSKLKTDFRDLLMLNIHLLSYSFIIILFYPDFNSL